jgi:hypothetical protein
VTADLAFAVDSHTPGTHGDHPQPAHGACCQDGMPVIDARGGELQVLTRRLADRQSPRMEQDAAG